MPEVFEKGGEIDFFTFVLFFAVVSASVASLLMFTNYSLMVINNIMKADNRLLFTATFNNKRKGYYGTAFHQ